MARRGWDTVTPATKTASTIKQQTNKRRHYRARTKARAIALKGGQCQRCGFADERALHFHHNEPLRRGRNGLSKKAMTSTESHRAVVRGDGKGLSLLCSNCIAIMSALDWTLNINTRRQAATTVNANADPRL